MKKILKGKYYDHYDDSIKKRHPSYVYKKDDKKNKYNIVCFTSSVGKHRIKLYENIDSNSNKDCYVLKSPRVVKRNSLGKELVGYKVKNIRDRAIIKIIQKKKK